MRIRQRLAVLSAATVLATTALTVLTPSGALAHGAMMRPGARTYNCWLDGVTPQGDIQPKNPACAAAVAAGGTTPLYNWFGVLRSDAGGRTTGFISDGQLCSGGNPTFAAYDAARNDWPLTHLTAGAGFSWKYSNWAHHPGTFYMYVTRDGFNPTSPLKWSDLESTPFLTITNPPQNGSVGSNEGHYYWSGNLPSGKSGRHIIYSRWVRSDSNENFFGCSDVVFDGGNGEVTGIGTGGGQTSAAPTTRAPVTTAGPTTRAPVTTAGPTTRAPGTTAGPTTGAPATTGGNNNGGACVATYKTVNSWGNGFQGEVTVKNNGSSTTNAWTATLTSPSGQTITQVWSGTGSSSGSTTTVKNANWNGTLGGGASTAFGFIGSGTTTAPTVSCVLS
ncbi:lytic polysaccharide monooxygenase [Luedemannella helvata]|uniref:Lytic polysaccharide monooxygenase n=1 Tax=Luedemannella helvata TaxID=349315 RepID=A0ABP4WUU8_9ACTN